VLPLLLWIVVEQGFILSQAAAESAKGQRLIPSGLKGHGASHRLAPQQIVPLARAELQSRAQIVGTGLVAVPGTPAGFELAQLVVQLHLTTGQAHSQVESRR